MSFVDAAGGRVTPAASSSLLKTSFLWTLGLVERVAFVLGLASAALVRLSDKLQDRVGSISR